MRCEPPIPAQFISTRAMPCAASAFARPALTWSSSVTSACSATPFTSAAIFSAFSWLWSSRPIFAPFSAMARAVAAPRPEPPPVMTTATSLNCILIGLLGRFFSRLLEQLRSSGGGSVTRLQHAAADQCLHVLDVVAADLVGDGADAARTAHRMPAKEQMIAGADQAGVEQDRIDLAEFARSDTLGKQPAMKIEQRRDEEF